MSILKSGIVLGDSTSLSRENVRRFESRHAGSRVLMTKDIFSEIYEGFPRESPGRNKYTRQAFHMLPRLDNPRILDIGCGPGGPTLELARLSPGEIVGIDIHQPSLDRLIGRIEEAGLASRVKAVNRSMFDMDFPDESFDIVWAEGSIWAIGFKKGLKEWRRLLKPNGFLVIHEMVWLRPDPPKEIYDYWMGVYPGINTVQDNLQQVSGCGYDAIGHFVLPDDTWWVEYYGPLERRIKRLRAKYIDDTEALLTLDKEQREIDMYKKYREWYGSAFFVMQKR